MSPLILICDQKNLDKEIKRYKFAKNIDQIKLDEIYSKKFIKKKIYIIDIKNKNSNTYIHNCFKIAFKLIKKGLAYRIINGPINKTKTLKKKYLGM
ncbi:MAG: 4-hydroxythreonine-4-phosphate dehydrogenase, partial [Candidatus Pelagibacter sp.]